MPAPSASTLAKIYLHWLGWTQAAGFVQVRCNSLSFAVPMAWLLLRHTSCVTMAEVEGEISLSKASSVVKLVCETFLSKLVAEHNPDNFIICHSFWWSGIQEGAQ